MTAAVRSAAAVSPAADALDPVTVEVIRRRLVAIADEVDVNITRTAFSPYIYEYKDYAVGIVDARGEPVREIYRMIEHNTRFPVEMMGDINSQIGGCMMGRDSVAELVDRYALDHGFAGAGPALIVEYGSSTLIGPRDTFRIGKLGEIDIDCSR